MMRQTLGRSFGLAGVVLLSGVVVRLAADDATAPKSTKTPPAAAGENEQQLRPGETERDRWMRLKVVSSQQVFDGLMNADFTTVERNARRLQIFNLLEQWLAQRPIARTTEYRAELNAFEYAVKELIRNAEAKDIDGALEAYVSMSRTCVRCHRVLRDNPTPPVK